VLERLDAELSETDDAGRAAMFGKVAVAVAVGNEDGAHKIIADLFQARQADAGYRPASATRTVQRSNRPASTPLGARTIPSGPGCGDAGGSCSSVCNRCSALR
jgi:hypothetical protein